MQASSPEFGDITEKFESALTTIPSCECLLGRERINIFEKYDFGVPLDHIRMVLRYIIDGVGRSVTYNTTLFFIVDT